MVFDSREFYLAMVCLIFEGLPQFVMLFISVFQWDSNVDCVNLELLREDFIIIDNSKTIFLLIKLNQTISESLH